MSISTPATLRRRTAHRSCPTFMHSCSIRDAVRRSFCLRDLALATMTVGPRMRVSHAPRGPCRAKPPAAVHCIHPPMPVASTVMHTLYHCLSGRRSVLHASHCKVVIRTTITARGLRARWAPPRIPSPRSSIPMGDRGRTTQAGGLRRQRYVHRSFLCDRHDEGPVQGDRAGRSTVFELRSR